MSIMIIFSGAKGIDSTLHKAAMSSYTKGFRTVLCELT
jgi:hypothetical protein